MEEEQKQTSDISADHTLSYPLGDDSVDSLNNTLSSQDHDTSLPPEGMEIDRRSEPSASVKPGTTLLQPSKLTSSTPKKTPVYGPTSLQEISTPPRLGTNGAITKKTKRPWSDRNSPDNLGTDKKSRNNDILPIIPEAMPAAAKLLTRPADEDISLARIIEMLHIQDKRQEERFQILETNFHELEDKLDHKLNELVDKALKEKLGNLEEDINTEIVRSTGNLRDTIMSTVDSSLRSFKAECLESQRKLNNIIIHNVPESQAKDDLTASREDRHSLDTFLQTLEIQSDDKNEMQRTKGRVRVNGHYRIGAPESDKVRPLVVTLNSTQECQFAIKQGKKHTPKDGRNQIAKDHTRKERTEYKKLKEELDRRQDNGERNLLIKNGAIVKKQPFRRHPDPDRGTN